MGRNSWFWRSEGHREPRNTRLPAGRQGLHGRKHGKLSEKIMSITGLDLALLRNFKHPRLGVEGVVK